MVRVLIVDDSAAIRDLLKAVLGADPEITIAGLAADGEEAVRMTRELAPDVISMDLRMPRLDGIGAIKEIMHERPTPIVALYANAGGWQRHLGIEALKAGALEVVEKPRLETLGDIREFRKEFGTLLKLMAEVKVVRRWPERSPRAASRARTRAVVARQRIRVVAVGASAGGPPTVADILSRLPGDLPCPILLVQHIAPGFAEGLAEWLGKSTPLNVMLAADGERARPGTVYVAPDDRQLGIAGDGTLRLTGDESTDGFRPSATYLLRSVARVYGRAALGVLLTGMGRDGAAGLLELRERGGVTIAQDKESSAIFGMPMEAIRLGAAEHVLPPARIAETIVSLMNRPSAADNPTGS